jgi:VIT1/CCC1 family predicted Fe2+/Mn2+ transporter
MSVGNSEVDAGGMHEALIGVGYTIGPMIGLVPTLLIDRKMVAASSFEPTILISTGVVAGIGIALVARAVTRQHRAKG